MFFNKNVNFNDLHSMLAGLSAGATESDYSDGDDSEFATWSDIRIALNLLVFATLNPSIFQIIYVYIFTIEWS